MQTTLLMERTTVAILPTQTVRPTQAYPVIHRQRAVALDNNRQRHSPEPLPSVRSQFSNRVQHSVTGQVRSRIQIPTIQQTRTLFSMMLLRLLGITQLWMLAAASAEAAVAVV